MKKDQARYDKSGAGTISIPEMKAVLAKFGSTRAADYKDG